MKTIIVISIFLLLMDSAFALPYTGMDLSEKCNHDNDSPRFEPYPAGLCDGYIAGVLDLTQAVLAITKNKSSVCIPNGVTLGQVTKIVKKYLNNHPERLNEQAVELIAAALNEAFPCKPNGNSKN